MDNTKKRLTIEKKGDVLQDIRAIGQHKEQGRDNVENMLTNKLSKSNMLGQIKRSGVEKEEGKRLVEQCIAAKSNHVEEVLKINEAMNNQNVV